MGKVEITTNEHTSIVYLKPYSPNVYTFDDLIFEAFRNDRMNLFSVVFIILSISALKDEL